MALLIDRIGTVTGSLAVCDRIDTMRLMKNNTEGPTGVQRPVRSKSN